MPAWRAWLYISGITEGPAFRPIDRHDRRVPAASPPPRLAEVVKRRAEAAGQDGAALAARSLRAGFATEAFGQGVPEFSVMRHGRWKSATSMRTYIPEGSLLRDNAGGQAGALGQPLARPAAIAVRNRWAIRSGIRTPS